MGDAKRIDLAGLTLRQLEDLATEVAEEIERKRVEARQWLSRYGGGLRERGPAYRNPSNPAETWSGRGPRPRWVDEALAGGATLDSLQSCDDLPAAVEPGKDR